MASCPPLLYIYRYVYICTLSWAIIAWVYCDPTFKFSIRESTKKTSPSLIKYNLSFNHFFVYCKISVLIMGPITYEAHTYRCACVGMQCDCNSPLKPCYLISHPFVSLFGVQIMLYAHWHIRGVSQKLRRASYS